MKRAGNLVVTTPSDVEIAMTREFNAPPHLVYEAWTKPELIKRWLGVFGGWELAVCEIDLRVGGESRMVWRHQNGTEMGMSGVYSEIIPNERIVSSETFDDPWYEGEAVGTVEFIEREGGTTLRQVVRYSSKLVRDAVLKTPMTEGVTASYDKLAELLEGDKAQSA